MSKHPSAPKKTNFKILMQHPRMKIAETITTKSETRGKIVLNKICSFYLLLQF